jgi:dGTP triphosphohydrolase
MANPHLRSELQISNIETNKQFCRLAEKTQVAFPTQGRDEVVRNRLTHSYEVATSASIIALHIDDLMGWAPYSVDYEGSVKPASLLHDIGHPSLGHSGAEYLDNFFKEKGLLEGFCDNNNTLTVIEKNHIMVSKHTICSVIKYPERLYPAQAEKYLPILKEAVEDDRIHFEALGLMLENQTRTIACQIMDEADRNTYICSDLSDFLCLGNTLPVEVLKSKAHKADLTYRYTELSSLFSILRSGDKTAIKSYFNNLKNQFNMNYRLTERGLVVVNEDLHAYREFLWDLESEYYIRPIRLEKFHLDNMRKLEQYVNRVVEEGFSPSRTYRAIIQEAKSPEDVWRAQRDMIAETTDWYVTHVNMQAQSANTLPADTSVLVSAGLQPISPEGMLKD